MRKLLWPLLAATFLSGCLGLHSAKLPTFEMGNWQAAPSNLVVSSTLPISAGWWQQLNDPVLDGLVGQALKDSPDLKAAVARVAQARGQYGIERSSLFPAVDANAGVSREGLSQNAVNRTGGSTARTTSSYNAGLDASWEIDLFGYNRHGTNAARANWQATEADAEAARLALVAQVVQTYNDLRAVEQRLQLAQQTTKAQKETLRLTEARYRAGDINGLDLASAQAALATVDAQEPLLNQQYETLKSGLAVLVGVPPTTFSLSPTTAGVDALQLPPVPAGLPASLLDRRPDVTAAAQRVVAGTEQLNQAEVAILPSFTLTANTGLQSAQLANLFANGSGVWGLGLAATQPIFHAGATLAAMRQGKGVQAEAVANYEKTVLTALQDVQVSLKSLAEERARQQALATAAKASARSLELSTKLYKAGEINYLTLLDAQRTSYASADAEVQSRANLADYWVGLVKALGGGYTAPR